MRTSSLKLITGVIDPHHMSMRFRELQRSSAQTGAIFSIIQIVSHSAGYALLCGITLNQLLCWFSLYAPAHAVMYLLAC